MLIESQHFILFVNEAFTDSIKLFYSIDYLR